MDSYNQLKFSSWLAAFALLLLPAASIAGGYSQVPATNLPFKWGGTITMRFDQGPLGALSNANADILANNALQKWSATQIPNCSLVLQQDTVTPELSQDHAL